MNPEQTRTEARETDLAKASWPSRYFSIRKDGEEIYVEDIGVSGSMASWAGMVAARLKLAKKAMPKAAWSATIEQLFEFKPRGARSSTRFKRYEIRKVSEDGKTGGLEVKEYGS